MEVQNKNNIRVILYILVLIAVFSIIFLIFKIEISNENLEKNNVGLVENRGFKANCVNSKNKILELHSFFVQEMEVQNGTN